MSNESKNFRILIDVYPTEDNYQIFRILDANNCRESIDICDNGGWFQYEEHIDEWIEQQKQNGYTFQILNDFR